MVGLDTSMDSLTLSTSFSQHVFSRHVFIHVYKYVCWVIQPLLHFWYFSSSEVPNGYEWLKIPTQQVDGSSYCTFAWVQCNK